MIFHLNGGRIDAYPDEGMRSHPSAAAYFSKGSGLPANVYKSVAVVEFASVKASQM
jgi:hypothetical protein